MRSLDREVGRRSILIAIVISLLALGGATTASAEKKIKSKKAQGKLVELNVEEGKMIINEKGKKRTYLVKIEGSVMTRTTSTMNAKPVKLTEIPIGAPVIVYWKPDENDKKIRRARKVDAPKVPDELLEEYE
jgi:hypothetical protein